METPSLNDEELEACEKLGLVPVYVEWAKSLRVEEGKVTYNESVTISRPGSEQLNLFEPHLCESANTDGLT